MTLEEIISLKLKSLYVEIERLRNNSLKLDEETEKLTMVLLESEEFIHTMSEDWANIGKLDVDKMTDYLIKYGSFAYDKKEVKETFRIINVVYEAIEAGIDTTLTDSQKAFIEGYLGNLIQMIKSLNESISTKDFESIENKNKINIYNEFALGLENLCEKVSDPLNEEILNESDFQAFYSIIEDDSISSEVKKQGIIKFTKYNSDRLSNTPKTISKISIDDIKDLFASYGFNSKKDMDFISRNKKELESRCELQNINSILSFMKDNKILRKFSLGSILSICVAGTVETVSQTYKKLESEGKLSDLYFQTPGVWVNNPVKKKSQKRRGTPGPKENPRSLYYAARKISLEDIELNEKFLKDKGFDISATESDKVVKLLTTPNYRVVENYDICRRYGLYDGSVKNQALTPLYGCNIEDRLDNLIEIGLLNGKNISLDFFSSYAKRYPSAIVTMDQNNIMFMYYLRSIYSQREYYEKIFSRSRVGMLTKENIPKFSSHSKMQQFIDDNFVSLDRIPNSESYDSIIHESDTDGYDETIFHEKEIFDLERQLRVRDNDYVYVIDDIVVSRLKVLKICSILRDAGIPITKNEIMYAVTKGMYLTKNVFDRVAANVGYIEEEKKDGLL